MIYAGIQAYILPTLILALSNLHAATWQWASGRPSPNYSCRGEHASGATGHRHWGGIVAYLHVSWCTHGNNVVHICAESWDALVVKYGAKVKISGNDTSRRITTSFTAYGMKRRRSAVSGRNFYLHTLYAAR